MNINEENLASDSIDNEIDSQRDFNEGGSLSERIRIIKRMLRTEGHIWQLIQDKTNPSETMVKLYLERTPKYKNDKFVCFNFTGKWREEAVKNAETYVAQELAAGTIKDYKNK